MPITINDITPISLCISTQELFDAKRFRQNFCDNILLRNPDRNLEPKITMMKRELNSINTERKFLEGHKAAIISNIDKILSLVSRYSSLDLRATEDVILNGKKLIERVIGSDNFERIAALEPEFKSKVMLPMYSLFIKNMKKSTISVV